MRAICLAVPTGIGSMPEAEKSGLWAATRVCAGSLLRGSDRQPRAAMSATIEKPVLILCMLKLSSDGSTCHEDRNSSLNAYETRFLGFMADNHSRRQLI
jgi:hypothetical protein